MGHTSGGVVTFSTKSGTDKLHGSVFEYIRNSDTDANSFAADLAGSPKPHFERNQYGYAIGGPAAFHPIIATPITVLSFSRRTKACGRAKPETLLTPCLRPWNGRATSRNHLTQRET